MGVCQSKRTSRITRYNQIAVSSAEQGARQKGEIKLLLLGAGESGKSTVLKQMRLMHGEGFSAEELEFRKGIIYSHIVGQLALILDAMADLGLDADNCDLQEEARLIKDMRDAGKDMEALTEEIVWAIKAIWADGGVQRCYERRSEYQLNDSTKYFIESVDRVSAPNYTPTTQDMLHSRVPTTGVLEVSFTIWGHKFRVFDVGGQRSSRRKWIHCFDDVNAIVYVVAISEYDQKLREDDQMANTTNPMSISTKRYVNRLKEAMDLFESVCNCRFFAETFLIVFLNKIDIFRSKIDDLTVPLTVCFQTYKGQQCYTEAVEFLQRRFRQLKVNKGHALHIHQTCATDTEQVQKIVSSVIEQIVQLAFKNTSII